MLKVNSFSFSRAILLSSVRLYIYVSCARKFKLVHETNRLYGLTRSPDWSLTVDTGQDLIPQATGGHSGTIAPLHR